MAKQSTPKSLQQLVEEAAVRQLEIEDLERQNGELTPEAYIEDALSVAGAMRADAERLLAEIGQPENGLLLPSFRRLKKAVRDYPRRRAHRRINLWFDDGGGEHLARLRMSRESLFAAAAMAVAKEMPQIFGPQAKAGDFEAKIAKLVAERQAFFDQIQGGWQRSDVSEQHVEQGARASGLCKLTVNMTGGQIPIGPDLGQRLTTWWCQNQHDRKVRVMSSRSVRKWGVYPSPQDGCTPSVIKPGGAPAPSCSLRPLPLMLCGIMASVVAGSSICVGKLR